MLRTAAVILAATALGCTGGPSVDQGTLRQQAGGLSFVIPDSWSITEQTGLQEGVRLSVVVLSGPKHVQVRFYHYHSPTSWTPTSFAQHLIETQPVFIEGVKSRYRTGQDESTRTLLGARHSGMRIPLVLTPGPADLPYHAEVYTIRHEKSQLVTYHQLPGVTDTMLEQTIDRLYETLQFSSENLP